MFGRLVLDMNTLGTIIKQKRQECKLKQKELAAQVGISGTYLSRLESNLIPNPNPIVISRLSEQLKLDSKLLKQINERPSSLYAHSTEIDTLNSKISKADTLLYGQNDMEEQVFLDLKNEYSVEDYNCYRNFPLTFFCKIDCVLFTTSNTIFGVEVKNLMHYHNITTNDPIIQSTLALCCQFYFHFKKLGYEDNNLGFIVAFIITKDFTDKLKKSITNEFVNLIPYVTIKFYSQ